MQNPNTDTIPGYRKLDAAESALIQHLKADGEMFEQRIEQINELIANRTATHGTPDSPHYRALALGKTHLQEAYMWLIRAVAAPEGFV